MKPIRITLLTAVVLIAVSAIACTPASQGTQSSESDNATTTRSTPTLKPGEPVPTLAGTPAMIYLHNPQGTLTPHVAPPPKPLTPPVLPSHLRKELERREATQEARRSSGNQTTMEDEKSQFSITLDSDERVNEVVKYLEKKSVQIAGTGTSESFIYPWIIAMIPISMIREISELEGVVRIRELDKGSDHSSNQRTQPQP